MDRKKLKTLIDKKAERNQHLNIQIKYLELVEKELSKTKLKRFFSTSYLVVKRLILITTSFFLITIGFLTYINTSWLYENTQIDEYLIEETQNQYKELAGNTIKESLFNLSKANSKLTPDVLFESIIDGFNITITNEVDSLIIGLSILSIIIGGILLYLARLTKKIRIRNKQISQAEGKIENILLEFKGIISSEENELKNLEDIYNHKIVGNTI